MFEFDQKRPNMITFDQLKVKLFSLTFTKSNKTIFVWLPFKGQTRLILTRKRCDKGQTCLILTKNGQTRLSLTRKRSNLIKFDRLKVKLFSLTFTKSNKTIFVWWPFKGQTQTCLSLTGKRSNLVKFDQLTVKLVWVRPQNGKTW